jgi:hypothetical protein
LNELDDQECIEERGVLGSKARGKEDYQARAARNQFIPILKGDVFENLGQQQALLEKKGNGFENFFPGRKVSGVRRDDEKPALPRTEYRRNDETNQTNQTLNSVMKKLAHAIDCNMVEDSSKIAWSNDISNVTRNS